MTSSPIEHIHLSQEEKDHLTKMKRKTGIRQWNTLCRWGFCHSLADSDLPAATKIPSDSNVEMTWKTFGGEHADIYLALLKERCRDDKLALTDDALRSQFRLHLQRGIRHLAGLKSIKSIGSLFHEVANKEKNRESKNH